MKVWATKYKLCSKCKVIKPITLFCKEPRNRDGLSWCNECKAKQTRKWRTENRDKYLKQSRERYKVNRGKRTEKGRIASLKLKEEILTHYGNGKLACVICGFSDVRALSIDHINGGGLKHRKSLGLSGGSQFYRWLEKEGFPEGYQTLCMNCQYTKKLVEREL